MDSHKLRSPISDDRCKFDAQSFPGDAAVHPPVQTFFFQKYLENGKRGTNADRVQGGEQNRCRQSDDQQTQVGADQA